MVDIIAIKEHIINFLEANLSKDLTYHGVQHTLFVEEQCIAIAQSEGITDNDDLLALQIAALYHDSGFVTTHQFHEKISCDLARKFLPDFGVNEKMIDNICEIIMATKFPHEPKSHLDMIICDADLDYLGREGFEEMSEKLRSELISYNFITRETNWFSYQIDFFNKHKFFTKTAIKNRLPQKNIYYNSLLSKEKNTKS